MTDNQNQSPEPPRAPQHDSSDNQPDQPDPSTRVVAPLPQPNVQDVRDLKTSQTLIMIANISGPVSLFIGGVLLGSAGFICGFIGYRKLSALTRKQTGIANIAARLRRSSIIGMVACGIAIALNAVAIYFMLPEIMQMIESGSYTDLAANVSGGAAGPSATWG